MTLFAKLALAIVLPLFALSMAYAVRLVRGDGPRELVQGATGWALLLLLVALAVPVGDLVFRWTRRAVGELGRPPEPPL